MRRLGSGLLWVGLLSSGCRAFVTGALSNALSSNSSTLAQDDDPELVAAAAPFGLETMMALLEDDPENVGLLTALASGLTQYAYGFVEEPAFALEATDFRGAEALRARARRLYLRARSYGLRGLVARHPSIEARLRSEGPLELELIDVPLLYWTAAAWGLAIANSLDDPRSIAELPYVLRLAEEALALEESYGAGALHELFITLESARPDGSSARVKQHFDRAVELSAGQHASAFVSYAEKVAVAQQDVALFRELLAAAQAVDVERSPDDRLANTLAQRRAARLLGRVDDLFLDAALP
ncbi:MAG: hypothetical protein HY791_29240 [Deltaproteobacteria bacterium]|nr:hypothetical protein [Deltaproteobacteria bacterium]